MADQIITIGIKPDGTLSVTVDKFEVKPNDNLSFKCDVGEFSVLFDNNRSPFTVLKKVHGAHKGEATVKAKIRHLSVSEKKALKDDRVNGATFKYGVAVMKPGTGEVLTLDPDIIIEDPGGGG